LESVDWLNIYRLGGSERLSKAFVFREWNRRRMTITALLSLHRHRKASPVARFATRDILRIIGSIVLKLDYKLPPGVFWMGDIQISGSRAAPK
jgi:hypothetical protein